jgi:hypothetical protein
MHLLDVVTLLAVGIAGTPCEERLREMEARLAPARAAAHGAVYHAPELAGFEPPIAAGATPLEFKGAVVQIGVGRAWLDGAPVPGSTARERLATLSAGINKLWDNYRLLHPQVPPDRQLYVIFDRRLTVREAAEAVEVIGREDRLVPLVLIQPLAKRRLWFGAFEPFLRVSAPTPDAVTSATPGTRLRSAFRGCPTTRKPPAPGLSDDEYRALAQSEALEALRACRCANADVRQIEEFLLWNAGVPEPSMRRLPLDLVASGGRLLTAGGDAPVADLLAKAAREPTGPPRRVTISIKAAR